MSRPERALHPDQSALHRFGYELRRWRKLRGLSQGSLGKHALVSGALIQRVEVGERIPSRDLASRCDAALGADGAILDAWAGIEADAQNAQSIQSAQNAQDVLVLQDGDDIVRRRAFLLNMALVMQISNGDPVAALEAIRHELGDPSPSARHDADLHEWNEIASEYGATYPSTAPSDLVRSLLVDFTALQQAFERYPREADQRELYRVTALLAGFLAQTCNNLGHVGESRRWWRTARQAADRAGDSYSPLWVRGREVVHAMGDRPIHVVLQLIDEAGQFTAGAPPALVLEYLGGKAQTLAMAERRNDAESALIQLRDQFSASSSAGYSGSLLGWGEERLRNTESFAYSRLGDYESVDSALHAASALYKHDPSNLRWPAGAELNRAFCLARSGDVGGGLSHARGIVARLPSAQRTQDIYRAAHGVLSAVPWSKDNALEIREYRDWLDVTFVARPAVLPAGSGAEVSG